LEYSGTLANYQKIQETNIKNNLEASKIIEENTTIVGNKPGIEIIVTAKNGQEKIKNMYVITLRGNQAYLITYTAPIDDYDKFLPTAKKMVDSLKIN